MTDREVQELFLNHSFQEAKRLLVEECERNGHELLGHENVFELKALATQGSRGMINTGGSEPVIQNGEGDPNAQSAVGAFGESSNGESKAESSGQGQGNEGAEQTQQQGESSEGGNSSGGEGQRQHEQSGEEQQNESQEESKEGQPPQQEEGEPKRKRRRRQQKQQPETEQQEEGEPNQQEQEGQPPQQTPDEKEAEAKKKMEEAKKLMTEAEKEREEQRRREEEQRKKQEEENAKNNRHQNLDEIIRRLKCLGKAFLVGPAGTGKSTLAMLACKELFDIDGGIEDVVKSGKFAQISFSPDTVSADMLGFTDVNGVFHETEIVRVFRDGGLILFDEMDDADASLLVKLNTMLANRVIPTPDGVVTQHPKAYIVGTANTYGTGGNSMYVGRNRLDAATLDRWKMSTVLVDYDTKMERAICLRELDGQENRIKMTDEITTAAKSLRESIGSNKWKQICSTRFVIDCVKMMKAGYKINQCVDTFLLSWDDNSKRLAKSNVKDALRRSTNNM